MIPTASVDISASVSLSNESLDSFNGTKMSIDTTVIPAGSSVVVGVDKHDHHGNRDYRNHGEEYGISTKDALNAGFSSQKDATAVVDKDVAVTGAIGVTATKDARYDIFNEMSKGQAAAALAVAHTNERVDDKFCGVKSEICHATGKLTDNCNNIGDKICGLGAATSLQFAGASSLAYQLAGQSILDAAKNAAALTIQADKNTSQLNIQGLVNTNQLNLQGLVNTNQLNLQGLVNTNQLALQSATNFAALSVEAVKNASASTLLATTIAASQALEAAKCCCEMKALVKCEADKTRDLITDNRMHDLQAQVAQQQAELLFLSRFPVARQDNH